MKTTILKLLLILFVQFISSAYHVSDSPNPVSIKIVSMVKVPVVRVDLNGRAAYFVIDSGSDISLINMSDAGYFNFNTRNTASMDLKGFSGMRSAIYRTSEIEILVKGHSLDSYFYAADLSPLIDTLQKYTTLRISGIIGLDLMREHQFEIDYSNDTLKFIP